MARLIAIDWDRIEARMIVARTQGDGLVVDRVLAVPLQLEGQENAPENLEQELAKALGTDGLPKGQTLMAIGRSQIELRSMKLPPSPDDELPEMVRFQALREFSSLKPDSPLDFLPLGDAGSEPGEVMAAAISTELATQIHGAITSQGHEPLRTVMRPCSTASLAIRRVAGIRGAITLIIAQQSDSAELVVTKDGIAVFSRSFRMPIDWHPGETGEPLVGEVRRTIAAAQNQLGGMKIEQIVLFGTEAEHDGLRRRLQDRTNLNVELLDPFDSVRMSDPKPKQPERYAALLGMLQDEASGVAPVIDFSNPRKKPEAESNRRQTVLYAALAATLLLGICFLIWMQFNKLERQVSQLKSGINKYNRENKKLEFDSQLFKTLDTWKKADRNWLDELVHLSSSENLTADDFRLESLNASSRDGYRGTIDIQGRAKDLDAQQRLQIELDDETHDVEPGRSWNEKDDDRYPKAFTTIIRTDDFIPVIPTSAPAPANAETAPDNTSVQ